MTGAAGSPAARLLVFGEKYGCDYWYRGFDGFGVRELHPARRRHGAYY
jgi:hypothetical protein